MSKQTASHLERQLIEKSTEVVYSRHTGKGIRGSYLGKYPWRESERNGLTIDYGPSWFTTNEKDKKDFTDICKIFNHRINTRVEIKKNENTGLYEVEAIEKIHIGYNSVKSSDTGPCEFTVMHVKFIKLKKDALYLADKFREILAQKNPYVAVNTSPGGCAWLYSSKGVYWKRLEKIIKKDQKLSDIVEHSLKVQSYFNNSFKWNVGVYGREEKLNIQDIPELNIPSLVYTNSFNYKIKLKDQYTPQQLLKWVEAGTSEKNIRKRRLSLRKLLKDPEILNYLKNTFEGIHSLTLKSIEGLYGELIVRGRYAR